MRSHSRGARNRRFLSLLLAGAVGSGCNSLEVTNPNQQGSDNFWRNEASAQAGLIAVYNTLAFNGNFGRWQVFAHDLRSDIGTARGSPWGELVNFNRFQLSDYNFELNRELWAHSYELIKRANEVTANVPGIPASGFQNPATRDQIVGQAKFLRALGYYNLVTLYDNVPLITEPLSPEQRIGNATPEQVFAQIEQDLVDAAAALPESWPASQGGRPTKWAALGVLGRVRMQRAGTLNQPAKWAEAASALAQVVTSNRYDLLPDYRANFVEQSDNANVESIFEVQSEDMYPIGVLGISFPKMVGPCYRASNAGDFRNYDPTYCDGRPTRWYVDEFLKSRTTTGDIDPRMDATVLFNHRHVGDTTHKEQVYGRDYYFYFRNDPGTGTVGEDTLIFFRKYGESYLTNEQRWDNPINWKVLRFADVLLMHAEALNESQGPATALQYVNRVRTRAKKGPVPAGVSKEQLRDTILFERMFEFGLEASRFNDLRRHGRLTAALVSRDLDFNAFEAGKSERLPIPTYETAGNPAIRQNPGW